MRGLILGLLSALLPVASCSHSFAAEKAPPKKKARTVKELVEFAMKNGDPEVLPERMMRPIGFDREMHTKDISYADKITPDHADHVFYLVYPDSARSVPISLLWTRLNVELKKEKVAHWSIFRTSLSGVLEAASISSGNFRLKELDSTPLNDTTRGLFEQEKKFFLETAVNLPINK